jgi:hypothetical protein
MGRGGEKRSQLQIHPTTFPPPPTKPHTHTASPNSCGTAAPERAPHPRAARAALQTTNFGRTQQNLILHHGDGRGRAAPPARDRRGLQAPRPGHPGCCGVGHPAAAQEVRRAAQKADDDFLPARFSSRSPPPTVSSSQRARAGGLPPHDRRTRHGVPAAAGGDDVRRCVTRNGGAGHFEHGKQSNASLRCGGDARPNRLSAAYRAVTQRICAPSSSQPRADRR